jgi:hypothetical protein
VSVTGYYRKTVSSGTVRPPLQLASHWSCNDGKCLGGLGHPFWPANGRQCPCRSDTQQECTGARRRRSPGNGPFSHCRPSLADNRSLVRKRQMLCGNVPLFRPGTVRLRPLLGRNPRLAAVFCGPGWIGHSYDAGPCVPSLMRRWPATCTGVFWSAVSETCGRHHA